MRYIINPPDRLDASVSLPASKSISNRALVINALAGSGIMPDNLSDCDDTLVMLDALRRMPATIDIGAAGTAMRFLTAYLAAVPGEHVITGTERMCHRPIRALVDALRRLGADITYEGNAIFPMKSPELRGNIMCRVIIYIRKRLIKKKPLGPDCHKTCKCHLLFLST